MFEKIKQKWTNYSNLGVKDEYTVSVQKRIILTNQVCFVAFWALLIMSFSFVNVAKISVQTIINFLSIFSILIIPFLNKKGYHRITSVAMSISTPIISLFMTAFSKRFIPEIDVTYYFFGRILLLAELSVPLILIDYSRKFALFTSVGITILCILFFDKFHELLGVGFYQIDNMTNKMYYSINYLNIFAIAILVFGFIFLLNLNQKYQIRINNLVESLTEKNEELKQQNEEITSQKDEIQQQRDIIDKKRRETQSSIIYAKRIQQAILPEINLLEFKNFIFFKPRDIVSGDFYFIRKEDNLTYISAADCTGHGVPGAFMSMLGITLLTEIINNNKHTNSAIILDELRFLIKKSLKQSGEQGEQQDGMDIAFCTINNKNLEMSFAGAHNPCWIFRNPEDFKNPQGFTIIELPADHQPVGIFRKEKPFTEQKFQLQKDDIFYIFSDGFPSQFGGEKDEKLKSRRFKNLFTENYHLPLDKQKNNFEKYFLNWKGETEQTDDVLIMGIKI